MHLRGSLRNRCVAAPPGILETPKPFPCQTDFALNSPARGVMYPLKKILVAVDYSSPSKNALRHATSLTAAHDAELEVIYVWAAPYGHADLEPIVEKTEKKSLTTLMLEKATAEMESFLGDVDELARVKH